MQSDQNRTLMGAFVFSSAPPHVSPVSPYTLPPTPCLKRDKVNIVPGQRVCGTKVRVCSFV